MFTYLTSVSALFTPALSGNLVAALVAGVLGLFVGSFLNVVIHRLPIMMHRAWDNYLAQTSKKATPHAKRYNLLTPRSCCVHCDTTIPLHHNLPVLSFLFLKGRCHACNGRISLRYPVVELFTGLLSAVLIWHFGTGVTGFSALLFSYFLITLCFIDAETLLLPDPLTLPLIWLGLIVNLTGTFTPIEHAVVGAVGGYMSLWTIYWCFKLTTGKEGMGYGDFKLLAALGAWLGWQLLPIILLVAATLGSIVGISMVVFKKHASSSPIPFGPYLALVGILALLYGNTILNHVFMTY